MTVMGDLNEKISKLFVKKNFFERCPFLSFVKPIQILSVGSWGNFK